MTQHSCRFIVCALGAWLFMVILGVCRAAAATCAAPDNTTECTTACATSRDCIACCVAMNEDARQCRRSCLSVRAPRPASRVHSPHRPTRAARGPTASGTLTGSCRLLQAGSRVAITLRVENHTGAPVTNVVPASPSLQVEANTDFAVDTSPSPPAYALARDRGVVTFLWRGRFNSAGGVGISVSASAASNGATINTPLVDCGTLNQVVRGPRHTQGRRGPSTRQPPSPALPGEAAQCAGCHEDPKMAFVAGKWVQSAHANSYGADQGNTFCAQCHSPFQADTHASAAANTKIAVEEWQGVTCSVCHPAQAKMDEWGTPIAIFDVATESYTPVALGDANQLCFHCHNGRHAARFEGPGLRMIELGVRCIDCHMAKIASGQDTVADAAAHDLRVEANLPYSCGLVPGGCHNGQPESWALEQIRSGAIHGSQ